MAAERCSCQQEDHEIVQRVVEPGSHGLGPPMANVTEVIVALREVEVVAQASHDEEEHMTVLGTALLEVVAQVVAAV